MGEIVHQREEIIVQTYYTLNGLPVRRVDHGSLFEWEVYIGEWIRMSSDNEVVADLEDHHQTQDMPET